MHCRLRSLALGIAALAASTVIAADHPVGGDYLLMKDPAGKPSKRSVSFKALKDLAIDPSQAGDPRTLGATIQFTGGGGGDGATGPIALAPGLWKGLGNPPGSKGYKYFDKTRATGVKQVLFKPGSKGGQLQVTGGGVGWPYAITQPQTAVAVRFQLGGETYCGNFTSFTKNEAGRVQAKNAVAPANCTPPVCGDGIATGTEECDDGGTTSGDGCSASCQLENTSALCAGVPATGGTDIHSVRVASGLQAPVFVTAPPLDPNRIFVIEQAGRIRIVKNGVLLPTPFLDVDGIANGGPGSEQGLLGLAFHPDYEQNGRFFVSYTRSGGGPAGHSEIAEYTVSGNPDVANPTGTVILTGADDPYGNHNGGMIAFGPDGFLYYGMGDSGSGDDPGDDAQDDASFFGKMYRIDVDNPPANPLDDVFAKGLRNPWRFSFDRSTGDLYIGDVGQNAFEEIDVQEAPLAAGVNWGWDFFEGRHCHVESGDPACPPGAAGTTMPALEYCHGLGNDPSTCGAHAFGNSVTGGYVYRGCAMSGMQGVYFYGDFGSAFINTFQGVSGGDAQNVQNRTGDLDPSTGGFSIGGISSFGEDARGEIYIADYGSGGFDGEIFKIVPGP
ncbi:MAG: PQQ-dependent sugar dehydrogenase [Deltaproteobacteria bacterium]|nr:PQQ-dependent sugar dehydrogenase [Deltaproteobacteria bacterium]